MGLAWAKGDGRTRPHAWSVPLGRLRASFRGLLLMPLMHEGGGCGAVEQRLAQECPTARFLSVRSKKLISPYVNS